MENNQQNWAKTFLIAYKYLNSLCNAIDNLVTSTATNSFYTSGVWREENSIMNISQKLLTLANRKIDYINLKVIVDRVLKNMQKKHAKILILRFIKNVSSNEIISLLNMSERTYYRHSNNAIKEFANIMLKVGFSFEELEKRYMQDAFVLSVYQSVINDGRVNKDDEIVYDDAVFNRYIKLINRLV